MKKMIAIICVLLMIFIGMYLYKSNLKKNNVNISEIQNIEDYISSIYLWSEITDDALPRFDSIDNAPDKWIWEVVKKNLEKYELSFEEIQEQAIEIFGSDLKKTYPKEGTQTIYYDENLGKYVASEIETDMQEDSFFIRNISKIKDGYEVEIVEYLEDYNEALKNDNPEEQYNVYIKNLEQETISTIKSTDDDSKAIEMIKENIDKFSTKKIVLSKDYKIKSVH